MKQKLSKNLKTVINQSESIDLNSVSKTALNGNDIWAESVFLFLKPWYIFLRSADQLLLWSTDLAKS